MFNKTKNKITALTAHNEKENISLDSLIDTWLCVYDDAEEINGDSIRNIGDIDEFAISLHGMLGIVQEIISERQASISELKPKYKQRADNAAESIRTVNTELDSICSDLKKARELETDLKKKNDELNKLEAENSALKAEILRMNRPELGELEKRKKGNEELRTQCESLREQVELLNKECEELSKRCEIKNKELKQNESSVADLNRDIEHISSEIKRQETEQSTAVNRLATLNKTLESLNPETVRNTIDNLLEEAQPLLKCWEALKSDILFEQVFKLEGTTSEEKLYDMQQKLETDMNNFKNEIENHWKVYGDFLKQWESKIQNK